MIEEAAPRAVEAVSDQVVREKCTKQLAQTVVRKLKCLSCPILIDLCTAKNATRNIDLKDTK